MAHQVRSRRQRGHVVVTLKTISSCSSCRRDVCQPIHYAVERSIRSRDGRGEDFIQRLLPKNLQIDAGAGAVGGDDSYRADLCVLRAYKPAKPYHRLVRKVFLPSSPNGEFGGVYFRERPGNVRLISHKTIPICNDFYTTGF